MKTFLLGIMILFTAGCATTNHSNITFEQAPVPDTDSNMAVIYFMRDNAKPTMWNPSILINDQKIGVMPNNSFFWSKVTPGNKLISTKWPWEAGSENDTIQVDVQGGATYYLILKPTGQIVSADLYSNNTVFASKFFQLDKNDPTFRWLTTVNF